MRDTNARVSALQLADWTNRAYKLRMKIRTEITDKEYCIICFRAEGGSATIENINLLHSSVMFLSNSEIAKLINIVTLN